MMIAQPILLGIVEGVTEFLPVSSTGHLILAGAVLGYDARAWATFDIVIQLGAIMAIVVLYWRTFWAVMIGMARNAPGSWRFVRNLVIGFLPAAVIGLALHKRIEVLLLSPDTVCWALIAGGVAILVVERFAPRTRAGGIADVPLPTVVGIGIAQCLAMIPGVSRSGATILGALSLGVERRTAAEFSFFLAIPTMLGATAVELMKSPPDAAGAVGWGEIAIGFVTAFVVAVAVVRLFVAYVSRHGFAPFAWYRIAAGAAALLWLHG